MFGDFQSASAGASPDFEVAVISLFSVSKRLSNPRSYIKKTLRRVVFHPPPNFSQFLLLDCLFVRSCPLHPVARSSLSLSFSFRLNRDRGVEHKLATRARCGTRFLMRTLRSRSQLFWSTVFTVNSCGLVVSYSAFGFVRARPRLI